MSESLRADSEHHMKKFAVMLRVEAFLLRFEGEEQPIPCGFYTSVYVEALDEDAASGMAVEWIKRDTKLAELQPQLAGQTAQLFIEQVKELTEPPDWKLPRTGFAFYPLEGQGD